jgi:transposase
MKAWTQPYMVWIRQIHFTQVARESTLLDYLHEVEHMAERVKRLEQAITKAVKLASPEIQEVVAGLQALRGIAQVSAVTIVAELGEISRFQSARQLMGYSGMVPSENSSGGRTQRGRITKTGNAHLRRIVGEAAWSYRMRPCVGPALRKRQEGVAEEIKEVAWKAQNRLHKRYIRLGAAGKDQKKIVTAIGRELLGFIWAIGIKAEAATRQRMAA